MSLLSKKGDLLRNGPYVAGLDVDAAYECDVRGCKDPAAWRMNTTGIDGDGENFCNRHFYPALRQARNPKLDGQAQQVEAKRHDRRSGRTR